MTPPSTGQRSDEAPSPPSRTGRASPSPASEPEEGALLSLVGVVLRHRRVVAGTPVILASVLVLHGVLLVPRTWTSRASFMPEAGRQVSGRLQGLASQFGFSLPSDAEASQSPIFYAELLRTEGFLRDAVWTSYPVAPEEDEEAPAAERATPRSAPTLVDVYGFDAADSARAEERAVERLLESMSVQVDRETGVVTVDVSQRSARLARSVARRLLDLVHEFNLQTRHTRAAAQREFLAERVEEAREDLYVAEDSLEAFLERNRRYENSPRLVFERQRLQRRVDLQQQLYTTLSQAYEDAKIDEVRTTPVVTVVQDPAVPATPDRRGLVTRGFLGLFLGGVAGVFWALAREYRDRVREERPEEYRAVSALWDQTREDVRRAWHRVRGKQPPGEG